MVFGTLFWFCKIPGGFSQGGALSLYTGLTGNVTVGGIIALSSWLPMHKDFPWGGSTQQPAVLQCHGQADPLVLYSFGFMTSTVLKAVVHKYQFKSYPNLHHSSSPEEIQDVKSFLNDILPAT